MLALNRHFTTRRNPLQAEQHESKNEFISQHAILFRGEGTHRFLGCQVIYCESGDGKKYARNNDI